MVNCISCQKSFRSRIGKSSKTRCEGCALVWRDKQLLEEENERIRQAKDIEYKIRDLELRERQIELERQKVTIKETSAVNGNVIELTCYYDQKSRNKIKDLLAGARRTLPKPPTEERSSSRSCIPRRRQYSATTNTSLSDDEITFNTQQMLRRPRKLPSIESFESAKSRITQRFST
ncbi:uncharacterized protein [Clytia hemisphaerica]